MRHLKTHTLAPGVAGLLYMAFFVYPWSPSTQPSGFSLTLDLDDADGNQAVSSLDLRSNQPVSIQIFGTEIQNATGISMRFGYDAACDLNNDGGIGFDDLLIFAESFGDAVNRAPVFVTAPPVTRSLSENTPSGQPIGDPVLATDADGDTLTYGLRGVHADRFSIGAGTGQLLTKEGIAYDHEASDTYTVTVRVSDGKGGRATVGVGIHVTDVDEPPGAPPPGVSVTPRNSALWVSWNTPPDEAGKPPVSGYEVTHRRGDTGDWQEALMLESRADSIATLRPVAGGRVTITATAGDVWGNAAQTTFNVVVTSGSPPPPRPPPVPTGPGGPSRPPPPPRSPPPPPPPPANNRPPTFNEGTSTTRCLAENTTGTNDVGNPVTASDSDGGTLSYDLEGADRASFDLDGDQLQTRAGETYDFEDKPRYGVTVRVEDGQGGSNAIEVTINLTDQQEKPGIPDAPGVSVASSTSLTATWDEPENTGPDVNDYDVQYREGTSGNFTSYTHNSADRVATITGLTPGTSYQVQVRAHNAEGWSEWSSPGTGSTSANQRPIFTDGRSRATRSFAENTTGVHNVGDPVTATDPENTKLTYSLEGTDADAFTINSSSGQLRTKSGQTYDYETKSRYSVSVKATNEHGSDRTISVNIDLTDVNEAPTITSRATFRPGENNQWAGRVDAEDVDSADRITDYTITSGADRDLLEINSGGLLIFKDVPNFENSTDADMNNEYIVVVTVTGGTGGRAMTAAQAITSTVTNLEEAGSVSLFPAQLEVHTVVRPTLSDPDGAVHSVEWQWNQS